LRIPDAGFVAPWPLALFVVYPLRYARQEMLSAWNRAQPEITDLLVQHDSRTLERLPVHKQQLLDVFAGFRNCKAFRAVVDLPEKAGILDDREIGSLYSHVDALSGVCPESPRRLRTSHTDYRTDTNTRSNRQRVAGHKSQPARQTCRNSGSLPNPRT
jgi:hypothetical protein